MVTGQIQENAYLVRHISGDALLVDPGDDAGQILALLTRESVQVRAILLTHAHFDHIGAVQACREALGCKVYMHQDAFDPYSRAHMAPARFGLPFTQPQPPDEPLEAGKHSFGQLELTALFTPGHAAGHLAFYFEAGFVLSGDSLFAGNIGRTDIQGGDFELLAERIKTQLYSLPENTVVLAGHGRDTTIGHEKANNPWVNES
jgi:hydroxyacylglutathione hydrolase